MPLGANKVALFGVAGVSTGSAVLLSTATASNDASIEFTLPTAYKQVVFGFYNVSAATDNMNLTFQCSTDGGSNFNVTMTTTFFWAYHNEGDTHAAIEYHASSDQAQGTAYQKLIHEAGNDADQSCAGELVLYNPASQTYVKHFTSRISNYSRDDKAYDHYTAGYFNDGANDLTNISFKMSSGNISSGTIKMWGIK